MAAAGPCHAGSNPASRQRPGTVTSVLLRLRGIYRYYRTPVLRGWAWGSFQRRGGRQAQSALSFFRLLQKPFCPASSLLWQVRRILGGCGRAGRLQEEKFGEYVMEKFEKDVLRRMITKGNLRAAMAYLGQFPQMAELYQKGVALYQKEHYLTYHAAAELNEILLAYQKYYRDVFWLELPAEEAAQRLQERLSGLLCAAPGLSLEELEELAAAAFRKRGLYALMGQTGGYYGPYVWRAEELRHYAVELPEGTQDYAVKFLDGFIMKSWLDYISFGETGTGGWSNGDGLIHCVRDAYDLESEQFKVSLLKHEAQHAMDQARYPYITNEELEYRAKLVELIYSKERPMLERFIGEADTSRAGNGHGLASERILCGFEAYTKKDRGGLAGLSIDRVQMLARALFAQSCGEMAAKYC